MSIKIIDSPRAQRCLGQSHLDQQQRRLRGAVAGADCFRSGTGELDGESFAVEGLGLKQLGFDVPKIVRRIAGRKDEKSPNQSGTAQHQHDEPLNGEFQRHGGRPWLCRFAGKLFVRVIFVAPIGVSLEPPHHHFIGLVKNHAQKPL